MTQLQVATAKLREFGAIVDGKCCECGQAVDYCKEMMRTCRGRQARATLDTMQKLPKLRNDLNLQKIIGEYIWDELKLYRHGWELESIESTSEGVLRLFSKYLGE